MEVRGHPARCGAGSLLLYRKTPLSIQDETSHGMQLLSGGSCVSLDTTCDGELVVSNAILVRKDTLGNEGLNHHLSEKDHPRIEAPITREAGLLAIRAW
jgi:hypothetical protein